MTSADLLLHPVRLRIVKEFLGGRALTTAQLAKELADVPVGSLYRHVALLTRAGVLEVSSERQVRGAVERTYTLRLAGTRMPAMAVMSRDEYAQVFFAFVAGLLADFDRYLASRRFDPPHDGAGFRIAGMWLTEEEHARLLRDLVAVIEPRLANGPGQGRSRRLLYSALLPASGESRGSHAPDERRS